MKRCYVGLGANLDGPVARVGEAITHLEHWPDCALSARSSLYASAPWGEVEQPDFVNAVVALETRLRPHEMMDALLELERTMGRKRDGRRWGPRRIDLDLLVYDRVRKNSPELTLPHPRLHERAFVLVPLAEIAPDLDIPGIGPVRGLLGQVDISGVEKLRLEK